MRLDCNIIYFPEKPWPHILKKEQTVEKRAKERITVDACANVTGSIKLPLLVIGKSAHPRCFKGMQMNSLPVTYKSQKNAWMNTAIFLSWFHDVFVPAPYSR